MFTVIGVIIVVGLASTALMNMALTCMRMAIDTIIWGINKLFKRA